ncbi:hypothetical protein TNCV_2124971 [Trichonephila clavipes]|nr:hypothetical protein TNCV_2124971 [Trichonephila clavipes]
MDISGMKVVSQLWNQFQTGNVVIRWGGQGHHRALTSAQDHYLALSVRQRRRTTAPQLVRDFAAVSGIRIFRQTVHYHLAETGL